MVVVAAAAAAVVAAGGLARIAAEIAPVTLDPRTSMEVVAAAAAAVAVDANCRSFFLAVA